MATRRVVRSMLGTAATIKPAIVKSVFGAAMNSLTRPQIPWRAPFSTTTRLSYDKSFSEYGDHKHWIAILKEPKDATQDELTDFATKTLAKVVGSEKEAKEKMYSTAGESSLGYVFRAHMSEEEADELRWLFRVQCVYPDQLYGKESIDETEPYDQLLARLRKEQEQYEMDLKNDKKLEIPSNLPRGGRVYPPRQPGAAMLGHVKIAAAPGIDEWRLFTECFIRLQRSYLSVKDFKYRFKVFKYKLETSELLSMKEDGCYEFDRNFDLSKEEVLKSSIHKTIHHNHMLELTRERYRKDPWRLFMNFVIRKRILYESCEDMMDYFKKFSTKFRQLERQNYKESKDWACHSLTPPFDISEAELAAS